MKVFSGQFFRLVYIIFLVILCYKFRVLRCSIDYAVAWHAGVVHNKDFFCHAYHYSNKGHAWLFLHLTLWYDLPNKRPVSRLPSERPDVCRSCPIIRILVNPFEGWLLLYLKIFIEIIQNFIYICLILSWILVSKHWVKSPFHTIHLACRTLITSF